MAYYLSMRIFLVRHGQSRANLDWSENTRLADAAIELTEEGHEQARAAGRFLADFFAKEARNTYPKVRLWHSPYRRAKQTADEIEATCLAVPSAGTKEVSRRVTTFSNTGDPLSVPVSPGSSIFWDKREHWLLYEQAHGIYDGLSDEERAREFPAEWAYYQKCKAAGAKVLAQLPLGESRIQVAQRIHQAFGTFHRDNDRHGIDNIVVVAHGTTNRCFTFAWLHKSLEWLETESNPWNCSIRLIDGKEDRGYIFKGFPGGQHPGQG